MFCTLTMENTKKRLSKNIKIEEKSIGSVNFLKLTCYKSLNPRKIEKKLKGRVNKIILSDSVDDIYFNNLNIYKNDDFLKSVATYTFKNILKLADKNPNKFTVCVIDHNGEFCDFVYSLQKYASLIKIVTNSYEKYYDISDKLYDNYGVYPVIGDEVTDFNICFDFDCCAPKVCFNTEDNYAVISKDCIRIGAGLSSYVPKGISECDFAGVLMEYPDFKRLRLLSAEIMKKDNKYYKINRENIQNFLDKSLYS